MLASAITPMRILLINKFYFPKGGADLHVLQLQKILENHGHEVVVFSMTHPQNWPSPYAKYFVSQTDFSHVRLNWQGLRAAGRMLYSLEAKKKLRQLIADTKPDIAHIHNIYHQLSPSVLSVLRETKIPVVQTLHDYSVISANYKLYAHGKKCWHGHQGKYYQYMLHRCVKNSLLASIMGTLEMYSLRWHQWYQKTVKLFISPSQFMIDTMKQWNLVEVPYKRLPNFITSVADRPAPIGDYYLFVGRLSEEKGVDILLRAVTDIKREIRIVGSGPAEAALQKLANELRLTNISFLGQLPPDEVTTQLQHCRALIVPSRWPENCPLVILEALAQGKPVIASRSGGIPEFVIDGQTGWLCEPDSFKDVALALQRAEDATNELPLFAERAWNASKQFLPEPYYQQLIQLYDSVRL